MNERRFSNTGTQAAAVRATRAVDGSRVISGYASVFYSPLHHGSQYLLTGDTWERILPGAFDKVLTSGDPVGLLNHNPDFILGRRSAGTLRLSVDGIGLRYSLTLPNSRMDVFEAVQRRDIVGSSFGFQVGRQRFTTERQADGRVMNIREILEISRLLDVSAVCFPAYENTTVVVASPTIASPAPARSVSPRVSASIASYLATASQYELQANL